MPKIEQMYAFIVEDTGPNDEGVIGIQSPPGSDGTKLWLPLVGADMARMDSLRPTALGIGRQVGKAVKLVRFTNRKDLEILQ